MVYLVGNGRDGEGAVRADHVAGVGSLARCEEEMGSGMTCRNHFDVVGVGPANLSLAALLSPYGQVGSSLPESEKSFSSPADQLLRDATT